LGELFLKFYFKKIKNKKNSLGWFWMKKECDLRTFRFSFRKGLEYLLGWFVIYTLRARKSVARKPCLSRKHTFWTTLFLGRSSNLNLKKKIKIVRIIPGFVWGFYRVNWRCWDKPMESVYLVHLGA
jgi:hypothetical protein